jgi:phosphoserine phosphatase
MEQQAGFTPENQRRLDEFIEQKYEPGSVATFDLDGTIVHNDTGEAVFYHMARQGMMDPQTLLESPNVWEPFEKHPDVPNPKPALVDLIGNPATRPAFANAFIRAYRLLIRRAGKLVAYPWAAFLLAGRRPDEIRQISAEVIEVELKRSLRSTWIKGGPPDNRPIELRSGLRPYEAMSRLIARMQAVGIDVWIVTASNRWTAAAYAERFLNLPPQRVIGITPRVVNGVIAAELDPDIPVTFGKGKTNAIRKLIGPRPVFAAGDTINQCEMLCMASSLRLVIHKGDRELLKRVADYQAAGETNWLIQPRFIETQ